VISTNFFFFLTKKSIYSLQDHIIQSALKHLKLFFCCQTHKPIIACAHTHQSISLLYVYQGTCNLWYKRIIRTLFLWLNLFWIHMTITEIKDIFSRFDIWSRIIY